MSQFTRFAVGRSVENGGGGDPSPVTAETVFQALLRGLAVAATGSPAELDGRRIASSGWARSARCSPRAGRGAEDLAYDLDPLCREALPRRSAVGGSPARPGR